MPRAERITLVNGLGRRLVAKLFTPKSFRYTIIISNGIGTTKEAWEGGKFGFVEGFVGLGYRVLTFDYTGRGESEGWFTDTTLTINIDDLKTAMNYAADKNTILIGESFGGETAIYVAANDKRVRALITFYAPLTMLEWQSGKRYAIAKRKGSFVGAHGHRYTLAFFEDEKRYDIGKEASKIRCPWLIFHGGSDRSISVSDAKKFYRLAAGKKKLVIYDKEGHVFREKGFAEAFQEIKKFLAELLS